MKRIARNLSVKKCGKTNVPFNAFLIIEVFDKKKRLTITWQMVQFILKITDSLYVLMDAIETKNKFVFSKEYK